jgi:hypothetical protein
MIVGADLLDLFLALQLQCCLSNCKVRVRLAAVSPLSLQLDVTNGAEQGEELMMRSGTTRTIAMRPPSQIL